MPIRLHGCAGWSAPLLFAWGKNRFSHVKAQIQPYLNKIAERHINQFTKWLSEECQLVYQRYLCWSLAFRATRKYIVCNGQNELQTHTCSACTNNTSTVSQQKYLSSEMALQFNWSMLVLTWMYLLKNNLDSNALENNTLTGPGWKTSKICNNKILEHTVRNLISVQYMTAFHWHFSFTEWQSNFRALPWW